MTPDAKFIPFSLRQVIASSLGNGLFFTTVRKISTQLIFQRRIMTYPFPPGQRDHADQNTKHFVEKPFFIAIVTRHGARDVGRTRPAKTDLTSRSRSLCRHSFSHKFECHRFQRDPPCTTYTLEVYKKHQNIGMHSRNRLVHRLCRECFTGTPFSSATRHFLCRAAKEVSAAV
uniref:Uncharacterized protein n=1 Tax=Anopheles coluzzii TaxID=1518534 RepID=A0A8W7P9K1_ANOCL